jgi:hypothetical protein
MKSRTANSAGGFLIVLLMMVTCADEKNEETYEDEEQNYIEAMYGLSPEELQAFVISDYSNFKKESVALFSITENHLKTMSIRTQNLTENNKPAHRTAYNAFYKQYIELKGSYDRRNLVFKQQLQDLKESDIKENALFKEQFKKDIRRLNTSLKESIDKAQH